MNMTTTCAVILDYFGSARTIACLTSLMDQDLDTVMVVDNSADQKANRDLSGALEHFKQDHDSSFRIHHVINGQNMGFAGGVNGALRWLETHQPHDYYLIINNDAEATPGMVPALVSRTVGKNNSLAVTAPVIDNGDHRAAAFWYHRLTGLMFSRPVAGAFRYLTGCCLLVNRKVVGDGLLDEDFFMYGEDVELCWRLKLSGMEVASVPQAVVRHEGTGSSRHGEYFYEYHMARGHLLLARKLAIHRWEIPLFYCCRLLALSARAVVRSIRYRSMVPIRAWITALRSRFIQ